MECFLLQRSDSAENPFQLTDLGENAVRQLLMRDLGGASPMWCMGVVPTAHLDDPQQAKAGNPLFSAILRTVCDATAALPNACLVLLPADCIRDITLLFCNVPNALSHCEEILAAVQERTGCFVSMGVWQETGRLPDLAQWLHKARENAYSYNLFSAGGGVYAEAQDESRFRPYNLTAEEDSLYAAVLNGSDAAIHAAVQHLTEPLFDTRFFCLRQLNRLELLYHGMRINWMEQFRIRHPQTEKNLTPPSFYFSSGFDEQGRFSVERLRQGLCHDLHETALFYRRLSEQQHLGVRFLEQVKEYIDFSYMQPLSQDRIAAQFYISANYLGKLFKSFYGVGMVQYINRVRIRHACELLEKSTLSICAIAAQTGFRDEKYFSRVFRQMTGNSPKEYRKREKRPE